MKNDQVSGRLSHGESTVSAQKAVGGYSERVVVVLAFFAIYMIWGSTYLAIRYAVATIPPLFAAGIRQLTAGAILLPWCLRKGKRPTWEQWRAAVVIGALFFLIGHGTLHWAERTVPSGLAALLIATEPIWVFVLSAIARGNARVNSAVVGGLLLGLGGVGLLLKRNGPLSGSGLMIGAAVVLMGAFSWSIGIIYSRRSQLSGHPLLLSALAPISGAFLLLIAGVLAGEGQKLSLALISRRSVVALAYLAVFGSVITFTAYNWLLERYSPTLVATHTYVNPLVAVLLGWCLGGESLTVDIGMAAAMIIGAVALVDRGTMQPQKKAVHLRTPV